MNGTFPAAKAKLTDGAMIGRDDSSEAGILTEKDGCLSVQSARSKRWRCCETAIWNARTKIDCEE
jgi:hypothetical protein